MPTAVTLRSFLAHNGGEPTDIVVLHDGVSAQSQQLVERSLEAGAYRLRWVDGRNERLATVPAFHLPRPAWFRLLAAEVVPAPEGRVLYLDTDVLVCAPLTDLWDANLDGAVIGAVRSVNFPSVSSWGAFDHWREHDVDPRAPYFNSGMMLIDVARWREAEVTERAMTFMRSGHNTGGDQQALNVVLCNRWRELHPRWNQQTPLLDDRRGVQLMYDDDTIATARDDPAVIHFLDRPKPWHQDSTHPARERWRAAAAETAFAPITLERTRLLRELTWRVKRAGIAIVRGK